MDMDKATKRHCSAEPEQIGDVIESKKARHDGQSDKSVLVEPFEMEIAGLQSSMPALKLHGKSTRAPGTLTMEGVVEEINDLPLDPDELHKVGASISFEQMQKAKASGTLTITRRTDVEQCKKSAEPEGLSLNTNLNMYAIEYDRNFFGKKFKAEGYGGTIEISGVGYPIHRLVFKLGDGILEIQVVSGENFGTFRITPSSDGIENWEISWKADRNKLEILCH